MCEKYEYIYVWEVWEVGDANCAWVPVRVSTAMMKKVLRMSRVCSCTRQNGGVKLTYINITRCSLVYEYSVSL